MSSRKSKIISLFLVLAMCLSLFVGCGSDKNKDSDVTNKNSDSEDKPKEDDKKPDSDDEKKKEDGEPKSVEEILAGDIIKPTANVEFPISEKPIKLKMMKPHVMYDSEYGEMALLKDYAEKTNIEIEWDTPPAANFQEKFTLAMNTGNLPDAIIAPPANEIEKYGQQGAFIDLKDIIDEHMPNLKVNLEKYPFAQKITTNDEGKVFSMPYIRQFVAGNNVMMVREDLLDKHNLEMPVTTDDWYNVMKVFKEKEGMTSFSGYGTEGKGMNAAISMVTAWGVYPGMYIAENLEPKDNKVHYGPIEPLYKEGIEWLRQLYAEGLIDPEIVTNDPEAFQAKVLQDKIGVWRGWINGDMAVLNDTAQKEGRSEDEFRIREAPIMKGPNGNQIHMYPDDMAMSNGMVISVNNKYPVETAKWADYWYSEIGQTYVYGIENVTYTIQDNGDPMWTDWVLKNPDGKSMNEARGAISFGRSVWPTVFQPWSLTSATLAPYVEEYREKYRDIDKMEYPMVPGLSFSEEDNALISQKLTDIETYVDETVLNFIIGKKSMDEWDGYVETVKNMGIEELIDIYQASYERWQKR